MAQPCRHHQAVGLLCTERKRQGPRPGQRARPRAWARPGQRAGAHTWAGARARPQPHPKRLQQVCGRRAPAHFTVTQLSWCEERNSSSRDRNTPGTVRKALWKSSSFCSWDSRYCKQQFPYGAVHLALKGVYISSQISVLSPKHNFSDCLWLGHTVNGVTAEPWPLELVSPALEKCS